MATAGEPLLRLEGVSKRFGNIVALDDVSFAVDAGRVTCLLGDNGAGKSTLIRILAGAHPPSGGRCLLDGRPVRLETPRHALELGIATVHQDLALLPLMSIWRNFVLGAEPMTGSGPFRRIDVAHCRSLVRRTMADLGIDVRDPDRPVGTLSGGERQCIAIARAIHSGARLLILDEPTAALGVKQAATVLRIIDAARRRGVAILLITHNPHHAHAAGDRFVILRHGRLDGDFAKGEVTVAALGRRMTGGAELDRLEDELSSPSV